MRSKHARAFTRLVNVGIGCRTGNVLELKMRDDLFTSKYGRICLRLMILGGRVWKEARQVDKIF